MKLTEEMQKRIEDAASEYIKTCKDNMHSVSEVYCKADFKAGAKFILMLPELREIREVLEWYATKGEGPYTDSGIWRRAVYALEKLKALGIVKEGEK